MSNLTKKTMRGYTYAQWHTSNKHRPKIVPTFERIDKRLVTWGGTTRVRNVWRMVSSPDNTNEYIYSAGYFHLITY